MQYLRNFLGKGLLLLLLAGVLPLIGWGAVLLHDFHTSLAEVEYNPKSKNFEVAIRAFTDDLEMALRTANAGKKIMIDSNKKADPFIAAYVQKQFNITDAKKAGGFNFVGTELEGDVTWIYFEITGLDSKASLAIQNLVLTETFDDQKNIVNVKIRDLKKTLLFDKSNGKQKI